MVVIDQETHVKLPDDRLTTSLAAQVPPGTLGGLSMLTSTNLRRSTDGGPALCECGLSPGMCPFFRTNWRWVAPQNPGEVLCADEVAAFVCEPDAGCPGRLMSKFWVSDTRSV
ncbi:MAG: hypothetical protein KVP17_004660 [Porospora cf. gigantea B]|uniref:uncharacterized protein n=1 Tax=Porospora cf. gigantea B TaxID=2853592 RepID=UPI00357192D5|nr:MAG: hypothetical protein KVP17_004660 [Porospora cf. gigantea B]